MSFQSRQRLSSGIGLQKPLSGGNESEYMPKPPQTDEGWYALHDFRTVDWDDWQAADERTREEAIDAGRTYLQSHVDCSDVTEDGTIEEREGVTAVFSVLGDKADILILHLRPTTAHLDTAQRGFEHTPFARFTERVDSYISVTEVSGYMSREYFNDDEIEDSGTARYIQSRIEPEIPDSEHVCFYPMDKKRGEEYNWYDLPFDERADLMSNHGEIGRRYAGKVTQIITGSIGFDDYEWGVTLFADDPTEIKHLLYEMRFDPSTSRYGEFGTFYFGRRFPPTDLGAFMAGETVPTPTSESGEKTGSESLQTEIDRLGLSMSVRDAPAGAHGVVVPIESDFDTRETRKAVDGLRGNFEHYDSHIETAVHDDCVLSLWTTERAVETASGFLEDLPGATETHAGPIGESQSSETPDHESETDEIREELEDQGIYAGSPHGEDVYALVRYADTVDELEASVSDLRDGFDRYDTHIETAVYRSAGTERAAVVSIWETQSAAETASGYLAELPGLTGEEFDVEAGFGTMGMFYTVKPEYREEFVETFDTVGELLADMDGHIETDLMINQDDTNDMFISSQWRAKEDAMEFFRSDAFRDTVSWGRDVLDDRPRHVFLA